MLTSYAITTHSVRTSEPTAATVVICLYRVRQFKRLSVRIRGKPRNVYFEGRHRLVIKKLPTIPNGTIGKLWCERRDLNPYESPHTPLKRARLPIPPLSLNDMHYTKAKCICQPFFTIFFYYLTLIYLHYIIKV